MFAGCNLDRSRLKVLLVKQNLDTNIFESKPVDNYTTPKTLFLNSVRILKCQKTQIETSVQLQYKH